MVVISVAADVRTPLYDEAGLAQLSGKPLGQRQPGKAGTDDQMVEVRFNRGMGSRPWVLEVGIFP